MITKSINNKEELLELVEQGNKLILPLIFLLKNDDSEVFQEGGSFKTTCFIHKGDNPRGFSWCTSRNMFSCWTNGCCGPYNRRGIIELIQLSKNITFNSAVKFLQEFIQRKDLDSLIKNDSHICTYKSSYKEEIFYPESILNEFSDNIEYLVDRGYTIDILNSYNVAYCESGKMSGRIVIPIRHHINNRIIGFTGRIATEDFDKNKTPKWLHTYGLNKSRILFNLNKSKEYIRRMQSVILTEGPLDVLKLEMCGIKNSVAIMGGGQISEEQVSLLLGTGATDVLIAMDGDNAGIILSGKIFKRLSKHFHTLIIELPIGKDIGDLDSDSINDIFGKYL